jgi:hypothetical protein
MRTVEVPHKDWARTLDKFSVLHEGSSVSLEVLGPIVGVQPHIRGLPLRGVTADLALQIEAEEGLSVILRFKPDVSKTVPDVPPTM